MRIVSSWAKAVFRPELLLMDTSSSTTASRGQPTYRVDRRRYNRLIPRLSCQNYVLKRSCSRQALKTIVTKISSSFVSLGTPGRHGEWLTFSRRQGMVFWSECPPQNQLLAS